MGSRKEAAFFDSHARLRDAKDFQGQVKRTVHGEAVGQDQVDMIVGAISRGLAVQPDDKLLDLCCGNGAITDPIFAQCRGGLGIDFAPYLIEVAKANFEQPPDRLYVLGDVVDHVCAMTGTERYTKALCYGAFQYIEEPRAAELLSALRRFPNLQRAFIGNLPDLELASAFFPNSVPSRTQLKLHDTAIGTWRTEREIAVLAAAQGWHTEIVRMPQGFFGAHYRFDAILTPC